MLWILRLKIANQKVIFLSFQSDVVPKAVLINLAMQLFLRPPAYRQWWLVVWNWFTWLFPRLTSLPLILACNASFRRNWSNWLFEIYSPLFGYMFLPPLLRLIHLLHDTLPELFDMFGYSNHQPSLAVVFFFYSLTKPLRKCSRDQKKQQLSCLMLCPLLRLVSTDTASIGITLKPILSTCISSRADLSCSESWTHSANFSIRCWNKCR